MSKIQTFAILLNIEKLGSDARESIISALGGSNRESTTCTEAPHARESRRVTRPQPAVSRMRRDTGFRRLLRLRYIGWKNEDVLGIIINSYD